VRVIEEHRDDNGRAWIAWTYDGYAASLQGGSADPTIYDEGIGPCKDDGITPVTLSEALAWALARTDWVIVRPRWDQAVHDWAGRGPVPYVPELEQDEGGSRFGIGRLVRPRRLLEVCGRANSRRAELALVTGLRLRRRDHVHDRW